MLQIICVANKANYKKYSASKMYVNKNPNDTLKYEEKVTTKYDSKKKMWLQNGHVHRVPSGTTDH